MNTKNTSNHLHTRSAILAVGAALLLLFPAWPSQAADEPTLVDKTKQTVQETTEAVQDAGNATAENLQTLWQRADKSRLKNRTRDEIVAWIFMGVLVGSVAGMMTSLKPSGLGKVGRLLLGLAGALIGGMVVRVAQINFGWGPVQIPYEELLFSLLGAITLIVVGRLVRSRTKKKVSAP